MLTPTDDAVDEIDETVTVGGTSSGLTVNSDTIRLTDDDGVPTSITLTVDDDVVGEDDEGATLTVTATLNGTTRFAEARTVRVSVSGSGTAGAVDFWAQSAFDVEIAAGAGSGTGTFMLTPTDDALDETDETVTVSGTSSGLTVNSDTITLTDDDAAPSSITLTVDDDDVGERDGATTLTVTATVNGATRFAEDRTVRVSVSGSGTAGAVDFAPVSAFDVEIAAGAASGAGTFVLRPTDDALDETDETVTVSGTSSGLTVNSDTISLTDDDATPTITLTVDDDGVGEGDGATTLTVTATVDGATRFADSRRVRVSVSGSGTATAVDFAAVPAFDVSIAAGAASGAGTFVLRPTDDAVDETDETVTVSGISGSLTVNSDTITLTDDDAAPSSITLTVDDDGVGEGDGATTITATATVDGATRFVDSRTVRVSVSGSGTVGAVDFAPVTAFDVSIAAGAASGAGTFVLTPTDDALDETDETVTVSGISGSLTVNPDTISLTDDDGVPTSITLTVIYFDVVGEDDGATPITVMATLNGTTRFAEVRTVRVSVSGSGTAGAVDFAPVPAFDISIAAGAASNTRYFVLRPTDDALDETDETITVSGTSSGLTVNSDTIRLTDDDGEPTLSIDSWRVSEGDSGSKDLTFTVTLSTASDRQVTVSYADATTGTATSGVDYTTIAGGTLTFPAGATSQTFNVSVTGDVLDESNETILVSLSDPTNATISTATGTGTIADDDAAPTSITLTVDDDDVGEGDGATTITVTAAVDGATRFTDARTVRVSVSGSSTAGAVDFSRLVSAFPIRIAAGAASGTGTFVLRPTDDALDETDETVTVSGISGSLTVNSDTIRLTDDDGEPILSINSPSVSEGDSGSKYLTFTVTLSAVSGKEVTVDYADAGTGTATPSPNSVADYTAITGGTLTFPAGATSQSFDVSVTGDVLDESHETLRVSLSDPTNATISTATGTGTITDDDGAATSITLTVDDDNVGEGDGTTTITVTATVDGATRFADRRVVRVSVSSGTATAVDFGGGGGFDVEIAAGAASGAGTFVLTPTDDALDETDETVTVSGTSSGLTVNSDTITLTDNDAAPSLSIDSPSVREASGYYRYHNVDLTFTVTLSAASGKEVTVDYVDAGTGTATPSPNSVVDYIAITGGTLTFPAGATSQTFDVSVWSDSRDDPDETVVVTLSNAVNATIGTATGTGTITDDDAEPTLLINADHYARPHRSPSVSEGDSGSKDLTFTVWLSPASGKEVTVDYADAGTGTATSGTDYTAITSGTLTFPEGTTRREITVSVTGDTVDEADETIQVSLSDPTNATISTATDTGTITDDDGAPTITLTVDDDDVGEGDGAATITVTATVDGATRFADSRTVRVSVSGSGRATAVDFAAVSAFDIEIAAGAASGTGTFVLTPTDDVVDEIDETVIVSGTSSGLTVSSDTISLTDDDGVPTSITLTVDDDDVGEGDGATTITVTATVDGATSFANDRTVVVSVSGSGTAGAVDFSVRSAAGGGRFPIRIAAGAASGARTFMLTPTDDTLDETDETVTVSGISANLTVNSDTIRLTDDDGEPTLSIDSWRVSEGDGGSKDLTFTVVLSAASGRQVTVDYADEGTGTATSGTDYTAITSGTLTFPEGITRREITVSVTGDVLEESHETILVSLSDPTNATLSTATGTGTITDDDGAPTITLTVDDDDVGEGDGATTITVTATVDGATRFADARTVRVSVSGSGTAGAVDFAAVSDFDVEIAAGAASGAGTFTLRPTDDALDETDETVTVGGTSSGLTVNSDTIRLTDDDGAPTSITLTVDDDDVGEGDGSTTITVTATVDGATPFAEDRTVRVSVSGSGTAGAVDFAPVTAFDVSIAAGATSGAGTFVLRPTDDTLDETDETVTVGGASSGLTVNSDTIRLTDDDGEPTLSIDSWRVSEGDGGSKDLTFTVVLSAASGKEVTVDYADAGTGTATSGVDYTAIAGGTLTFPAGATSQSFDVSVTGDVLDESHETLRVSLSDPTNATLSTATGTGTITDDDGAPTITLTVDDDDVGEGDGATTITVTAAVDGTTRFAEARTVRVSVSGSGTAGAVDFAPVSDFDIEIAAGAASGAGTFVLTPTDDAVDEIDETVIVSSPSSGLTVNSDTIRLTDDDGVPSSITLTVDDDVVGEGDGDTPITVTATLNGTTTRFAEARTVRVSVSGSGTAGAVDFSVRTSAGGGRFPIRIAAGAASGTGTFVLRPTDDTLDETDETVTVSGTVSGLTVNSDTIRLTDDDGEPTLSIDSWRVSEGDGGSKDLTFTVVLSAASGRQVTVDYADEGTGTATSGTDYTAITSGTLTFPEGITRREITVSVTGDVLEESNETILVSLSDPTNATLSTATGTGTITDDDGVPTITLTVDDDDVGEGDGATTITVTATVDGATRFADSRTVRVSVSGSGTAGAVDFAPVSAFDIEIAAGAASGTGTFTLTPTDDVVDEADETVTVGGTSSGLTVNSDTIRLTDDDGAPTSITLTVDDDDVGEDDGATTITVTATVNGATPFAEDRTVRVSVSGGGTAGAVDFAPVTAFDVSIAAGATSGAGTFVLRPTDDTLDETDETVTVSGASSGLTVNSDTIRLSDDDGEPTLSIDSWRVSEGDSGSKDLTFTVVLSAASGRQVTVSYADATTGTATSGVDYTAIAGGTLTFPAGATSQSFDVSVTGDVLDESHETLRVSLSDPTNATLSTATGTGTITDDDGAPTITLAVDDDDVGESDGATTITVTAAVDGTTRFAEARTVRVGVSGSGTAGAVDFAPVSGFDISITAGAASGAGTFVLRPTDNAVDETDETVTVSGISGSLTVNSGTITLTDDDAAPTLSINSPSVTEGDSGSATLAFTVTLSAASGRQVTVSYADATTGTATSGTDYAAITGGTLTFPAGATSQSFDVSVTGDVLDESIETILVSLSDPTNAVVSTVAGTGTGTITDDDAAPSSIILTVDDDGVGEGDGATTITVTAAVDGATRFADDRTVRVSVSGSGTAGAVDFAPVSAFDISIAAGAASGTGTFVLRPTDDAVDETDETVTVGGTSSGLTVNPDTISLTDDDGAPTSITLTVDDDVVGEADGATTITVTATVNGATPFADDRTVRVSVSGSGTAGTVDFAPVSAFDISIAAGAASGTGTFVLRPTDDAVDETDETVTVSGASSGLTVKLGHDRVDRRRRGADFHHPDGGRRRRGRGRRGPPPSR